MLNAVLVPSDAEMVCVPSVDGIVIEIFLNDPTFPTVVVVIGTPSTDIAIVASAFPANPLPCNNTTESGLAEFIGFKNSSVPVGVTLGAITMN